MMVARQQPPNRRLSENFDIEYRCSISRYPDGRIAEIFLSNNKADSDSDTAAKDSAVVCSIALQYGVLLDVIRNALMRDSQGRSSGPLGVALDLLAAHDEAG